MEINMNKTEVMKISKDVENLFIRIGNPEQEQRNSIKEILFVVGVGCTFIDSSIAGYSTKYKLRGFLTIYLLY